FVTVPLPLVALGGSGSPLLVDQALSRYEQEAKVVDARLFREVTLELKGASLEAVCQELERQTGVHIAAARGVADEKATIFVKDRAARDLLREIARLFSYQWRRSGDEKTYRYQLVQDLRSQLAEEDLRNQDLHAAALALDQAMQENEALAALSP